MKKKIITSAFVLLISTVLYADFLDDTRKKSPLKKSNKNSLVTELQKNYRDIYKLNEKSVVFISTEKTIKGRNYSNPFMDDPIFKEFFGQRFNKQQKNRKAKGLGTGFIVSKSGYICTNNHVVANMDTVTVTINKKDYKAKVIGTDQLTDIALLKIKGKNNFKPVYFGNSNNLQVGDIVVAIGNPFGLKKTFTSGIISAKFRKNIDKNGNSLIQTDTSINPGNSGGPLLNLYGEVIGMNNMIFSKNGGNLGIGFAIPINLIKKTITQLKKDGRIKRGKIGVMISPLTKEAAKEFGLKKPEGALIGNVEKNGPADKGGIKQDDIILKVNGKKIKDYRDLQKIIRKTKIGKTVRILVLRNKIKISFWVTVKDSK